MIATFAKISHNFTATFRLLRSSVTATFSKKISQLYSVYCALDTMANTETSKHIKNLTLIGKDDLKVKT